MPKYEIRESNGKYWVGHFSGHCAEWWDADAEGFDTLQDAEAFRREIQDDQPEGRE